MKVDKANPFHWAYLLLFGLNVVVAMLLRPFLAGSGRQHVVFYGHRLAGNLQAIQRGLARDPAFGGMRGVFLTMDPAYHRRLLSQGEPGLLAISPACIPVLASARAIVSDHGLHAMQAMLLCRGLKFFDVWHGIPFKGFDQEDFAIQRRFDEAWVASPLMKEMYAKRFGFSPQRVHATGYARTDVLVERAADAEGMRARMGLPPRRRLVLYAPTWRQDDRGRDIYPFGSGERRFLTALAGVCARHDASLLVRTHLNSGGQAGASVIPGVCYAGFGEFPDTESVLMATDVLVCDWSSIAFDFLLLDRPTVFLDVPPPFAKGFSLGPEYRFGPVAGDMDGMLACVGAALADERRYRLEYGSRHAEVRREVYGGLDDGRATERCLARLGAAMSGSSR